MKKITLFFLIFCLSFSASAHALKIFGFGSDKYDVIFLGTPISVHGMKPGEPVDAIEGSPEDGSARDLVVFKIERVILGEFATQRRGGPSRFEQMSTAMKNKEVMDVIGFNFKNPEDQIAREKIRIAVKNSGVTFGLTPGEDLAYFEHKIYLKRISSKPEVFVFIKSQPVKTTP